MEPDHPRRHPTRIADLSPTPVAEAGAGSDDTLLTACLDGLMRYLLTGCRLHAERAMLLLERAEADGVGDETLQMLCRHMSERLRDGGRLGHDATLAGRGAAHV